MVSVDKNNRSVSLLRYLLILTTKDLHEIFITENLRRDMREIIHGYFSDSQPDTTELISTYIHSNYIEVNFQTLPTVDLSKLISNLKSITARKFLKNNPAIKQEMKGCWNQSYFIATREQMVDEHIKIYLDQQYSLRAAKKILNLHENSLVN